MCEAMENNVFGYVNGEPVYSRDEFVYKARRFGELKTDQELMDFAKNKTSNWSSGGHRVGFVHYYLSDYAMSEPYRSLTKKEFERLKKLQEAAKEEWEAEQAKYNFRIYEGRPLTEAEVRMFLDKKVENAIEQWGQNNFWTDQAKEYRDKALSDFKNGKVISVATEDFTSSYGNGTGSFDRVLYSDGTINEHCYGYLD